MVFLSRPFWTFAAPLVRERFPHTEGISAESFYRAVNRVAPGLIRVDADEVTYPFHIILRQEARHERTHGGVRFFLPVNICFLVLVFWVCSFRPFQAEPDGLILYLVFFFRRPSCLQVGESVWAHTTSRARFIITSFVGKKSKCKSKQKIQGLSGDLRIPSSLKVLLEMLRRQDKMSIMKEIVRGIRDGKIRVLNGTRQDIFISSSFGHFPDEIPTKVCAISSKNISDWC